MLHVINVLSIEPAGGGDDGRRLGSAGDGFGVGDLWAALFEREASVGLRARARETERCECGSPRKVGSRGWLLD
jgi:hypothetical protein